MKRWINAVLLSVILCASIFAQDEIVVKGADGEAVFTFLRDTPDPAIRQLPREITSVRQRDQVEFIRLLAAYINENSTCDFDRLKKAHDWVALNIRYDTQSYFSGRYASQSFNDVIRRGNAVCAGYAEVLKYICDILEIECIIVSGYARGAGSDLFRFENVRNSNHAWNIVTINGKRYLIDSTWNAGYLSGRSFQARYSTNYFLYDPALFIYTHFPVNSANQLLDQPLNAEEFDALPFLRPLFFQAFETWPSLARITEVSQGEELEFEFSLKEGYELSYFWETNLGSRVSSFYPPVMEIYRIPLPRLRPGRYSLQLYIRRTGERTYWQSGEFGFHVR